MEAMSIDVGAAVQENMDAQLRANDGYAYSLHSIWRAAGSPVEKSPARWLKLAGAYVTGYKAYLQALHPRDREVTWVVSPESVREDEHRYKSADLSWEPDDDHGRVGDTIAVAHLARDYAVFLGSSPEELAEL